MKEETWEEMVAAIEAWKQRVHDFAETNSGKCFTARTKWKNRPDLEILVTPSIHPRVPGSWRATTVDPIGPSGHFDRPTYKSVIEELAGFWDLDFDSVTFHQPRKIR